MIAWKQLQKSFGYATNGLSTVFRSEQSFRLQSIVALCVVVLAMYFRIPHLEFIILLLLIAAVLILELVNSIFERMLDAFKPRLHPIVKEAKDMMAAAVLLMSLFAFVIGILIFLPYVRLLFL
ncbi:MAG: diacylglycerol kinase family protein [Candidatus Uhrbacteria bacterium]|nr:diacylglycerol kinase family protein [Candidatus Uhrbacteria bacterium]